ncbi:tyrosine-type recombinase/integrase [Rhodocyclus tenuis]|uniref:Integrase n=1 Tax=Rhodocyclus tenuis TaxID=1066 RepID=A0A840GK30_RHOTE|nr:tyrosine-type recombinase/integrase [Rhodocyclus tenuis]MBB4248792.1 integrase [Rhodocyclus tenuis]
MKHYKVVTAVHAGGERMSMVIDLQTARPDEHALTFLINNYRGYAPNTILRVAESIALTLEWGASILQDHRGLVGRLLAGEIFSAAEIFSLSEFLRTSRQRSGGKSSSVVCAETHLTRLLRASEFCSFVMKEASVRIPLSDPRSKVFIERIHQLETAFSDMRPTKPVAIYSVKSLTPRQADRILELLDPENPANPFSELSTRIRNQSIFELMYYTGIRLGELLNLRVQDVEFGNPTSLYIVRRPHAADDPRPNPAQVKRKSRVLPLSHQGAAKHLKEYLDDIRPELEKRYHEPTSLMFLSIDRGTPLSARAVQKIFKELRAAVCDDGDIDGFPMSGLTPMSMRHTFSNDTEESLVSEGLTEEERRPILMQLRGDSSPRSVEPYIQRTREKRSRKHLITRQRAMFAKKTTGG